MTMANTTSATKAKKTVTKTKPSQTKAAVKKTKVAAKKVAEKETLTPGKIPDAPVPPKPESFISKDAEKGVDDLLGESLSNAGAEKNRMIQRIESAEKLVASLNKRVVMQEQRLRKLYELNHIEYAQ